MFDFFEALQAIVEHVCNHYRITTTGIPPEWELIIDTQGFWIALRNREKENF